MMQDYLVLVIKTLMHRKMRSWLTILGVVIGVAAILSLITLGEGMKTGIQEQFEQLGISNIRVIPGDLNGPPTPGRTLPNDIVDKINAVKGVDFVDPVVIGNAVLEFNNEEKFLSVIGTDTSLDNKAFIDLDVGVEEGRFFSRTDRNVVIIGKNIATDAFKKELRVRNSILIDGKKFTVIGIFEKSGAQFDSNIYVPISEARDLFDQQDGVNGVVVHLEPGLDINKMALNIERVLARDLDEEEFDLFTPEQILDQINAILGVVQIVVSGIAAVSLVVGAVGIMNSMFTSVLERTNEIGLMKSVGARNRDILLLFVLESGLVGLVGGVIGLILGSALAFGLGAAIGSLGFFPIAVTIQPTVVVLSLLFAFIVGIISGAVPAMQAAKLKPVDALRYE